MQTGSFQLKILSCIHSRSSALVSRVLREMSGLTPWLGQPPSTITSPWNLRLWWLMSKYTSNREPSSSYTLQSLHEKDVKAGEGRSCSLHGVARRHHNHNYQIFLFETSQERRPIHVNHLEDFSLNILILCCVHVAYTLWLGVILYSSLCLTLPLCRELMLSYLRPLDALTSNTSL